MSSVFLIHEHYIRDYVIKVGIFNSIIRHEGYVSV